MPTPNATTTTAATRWSRSDAVPFAIGFLLMAAYWPGISGAATTPRWDVGVIIALALFFASPSPMTRAHWCGVALVGWLVVSIAWSLAPLEGFDEAAKLAVIAAAFGYGATLADVRALVMGAAIGIALSSIVAVAQWFGWNGIEQTSDGFPAGLFYNHNRLAEAAVLVGAALIALRMWWWLPVLLPSLILPQGRGAWLAAGVVVVAMVWKRGRTFERFMICAILAQLVLLIAMTSAAWRSGAIDERLALWDYTVNHLTWRGHGLGSFAGTAQIFLGTGIDASVAEHPHNEYLWLAYEGGIIALGLSGALAVSLWRSTSSALGLVLIAIGVEACFAMPFHDPASVLFAALCAGHLARPRDRVRLAADDGGGLLRPRLAAIPAGRADV